MHHLNEAFHLSKPLLINPADAKVLIDSFNDTFKPIAEALTAEPAKAFTTLAELVGKKPEPYIDGNVGVIPVAGPIGQGLMPIEKMMGSTDVNDISEAIRMMEADPMVTKVVFDLNTPGGNVMGVPELADQIYAMKKPTVAFARKALSAGYWLASAADRVVATTSSQVGSIGVFVAVTNTSEMQKKMGVETKLIKAGRYKAIGYPGTIMDDEDEKMLQAGVDKTHRMFKASVMRKRSNAKMSAMEGQVFDAEDGVSNGLVTGIVPSFQSLLASLRQG